MNRENNLGADNFGMFMRDLDESKPKILQREQINQHLAIFNDPNSSEKQKKEAKEAVFLSVSHLMVNIIQKTNPLNADYSELVGEGYEVLDGCMRNYDPNYRSSEYPDGIRFPSYFYVSFERRLKAPASVIPDITIFTVSSHAYQRSSSVKQLFENFCQENGYIPNTYELYEAYKSGIVEHDDSGNKNQSTSRNQIDFDNFVVICQRLLDKPYINLEATRTFLDDDNLDSESLPYSEKIPDGHNLEESVEDTMRDSLVREAISKFLDPDTADTIRSYYGIGSDVNPKKLDAISKEFGLSKEIIRQRILSALRSLRRPSVTRNLRDFI